MSVLVREYATLTCDASRDSSMDLGVVSPATFDWLLELQQSWKGKADLLAYQGKNHLKLCSYIGYLQSPTGEGIEILPKTARDAPCTPDHLRNLLQRMLRVALGVRSREANAAELLAMKQPLHEWVLRQFLSELADLIRRGLRFDYQTIDDECAFVRGRLDMNRQLRQTPDKAAKFNVSYAEFTPQRLENRLIRTALDAVLRVTQSSDNWRLANTLRQQMASIEPIQDPLKLFHRWADNKMLVAYRQIRPWCRLILEKLNPNFQKGQHQGIALLFPMEQLYESYLGHCLRGQMQLGWKLTPQAKRQHLLSHIPPDTTYEQNWFALKPDFLVQQDQMSYVLDAKWKLLDQFKLTSEHKYGIDQGDLYQMFAYGHKYLAGRGNLMLIYPQHQDFTRPLPVFRFDNEFELWCVPFNLNEGVLVAGDWEGSFACFKPAAALGAIRRAS